MKPAVQMLSFFLEVPGLREGLLASRIHRSFLEAMSLIPESQEHQALILELLGTIQERSEFTTDDWSLFFQSLAKAFLRKFYRRPAQILFFEFLIKSQNEIAMDMFLALDCFPKILERFKTPGIDKIAKVSVLNYFQQIAGSSAERAGVLLSSGWIGYLTGENCRWMETMDEYVPYFLKVCIALTSWDAHRDTVVTDELWDRILENLGEGCFEAVKHGLLFLYSVYVNGTSRRILRKFDDSAAEIIGAMESAFQAEDHELQGQTLNFLGTMADRVVKAGDNAVFGNLLVNGWGHTDRCQNLLNELCGSENAEVIAMAEGILELLI
jgi:hypothetical protein